MLSVTPLSLVALLAFAVGLLLAVAAVLLPRRAQPPVTFTAAGVVLVGLFLIAAPTTWQVTG